MSRPRVRAGAGPALHSTKKAIYKPFTALPQSPSRQPFSTSSNDKPPASKKQKVHHHAPPDASNSKSQRRSLLPATPGASTSRVDLDGLPVLEYDLDKDPTEQVYVFQDHFQERSPHSAILSARFIHAHLFKRPPCSTASGDELTNSEVDLVTEFIEPAAIGSVGPHDEVTPSYSVDSADVLGSSHPSSGSGNFGLGGTAHLTADPFALMTMDDVINQPPAIDPSLLGGTPAFSEPRSPSPTLTTFRDFRSQKKAQTPPPHPALKIRVPGGLASTSGSNSAKTSGDPVGNLGGGTAKFYKNGELQTPPYLSNSQNQRSRSAKATLSIHPGCYSSLEVDSPLTEFDSSDMLTNIAASTSSIATHSGEVDTADEEATVISNRSSTPPPRPTKTTTARKQKSSTNQKGPYRTAAVNESSNCHQCRRTTTHPKMKCRTCTKHYCILCIVKRCVPSCWLYVHPGLDCILELGIMISNSTSSRRISIVPLASTDATALPAVKGGVKFMSRHGISSLMQKRWLNF
jgi:hypothetical protein